MPKTLSEEDYEAIAHKVVEALARRLSAPAVPAQEPKLPPPSPLVPLETPHRPGKLAYRAREACELIGVSYLTLLRLRRRKLIKSLPGIRHLIFSREELERFVHSASDDMDARGSRPATKPRR